MKIVNRRIKSRSKAWFRSDNSNAVRNSVIIVVVKCCSCQCVIQRTLVVRELILRNFLISCYIRSIIAFRKAYILLRQLQFFTILRILVKIDEFIFIAVDYQITSWHIEMKILQVFNPRKNRSALKKNHSVRNSIAVVVVKNSAGQREIQTAFVKRKLIFFELFPTGTCHRFCHLLITSKKFNRAVFGSNDKGFIIIK